MAAERPERTSGTQQNLKSVTYENVRQIISRPPDRRKDFEINNILSWFRSMKDTKVLGQLKPSILFDVIKHVQFITKDTDELIIRQGEQGDCMYVLLRGRVTIYHNYGVVGDGTGEDGDAAVAQTVANSAKGEALRLQLGAFVVTLKEPGSAFGEVSLLTDNGTRSASIIADEPTDLIKIDRALYNRSVRTVLAREFEQKANFIDQHPHFQNWAPKYRKQLTMALEKEILSYEHALTKQAAPVDAIYFIVSGEVKIIIDPHLHFTQYPKLLPVPESTHSSSTSSSLSPSAERVTDVLRTLNKVAVTEDGTRCSKKTVRRHQSVEVCLLGVNEAVGDIEALMGLTTYMQTSICSQPCEVLALDMKHYERLLVRRNPKTIDGLRLGLEIRIRSRIGSRYLTSAMPLLERLAERAAEYRHVAALQSQARSQLTSNRRPIDEELDKGRAADNRAAVNNRHRQNRKRREQAAAAAAERIRNKPPVTAAVSDVLTVDARLSNPGEDEHDTVQPTDVRTGVTTSGVRHGATGAGRSAGGSTLTDVETASGSVDDNLLELLENKMRDWLLNEGRRRATINRGESGVHQFQLQQQQQQHRQSGVNNNKELTPRITRLRRANTECDQIRPGAKIVMRRKRMVISPFVLREQSARMKDCTDAQLAYYRTALTDPVPIFTRT